VTRALAGAAPDDERRLPPEVVFAAGLRNHHVSNTAYPIAHQTTWKPYRVARERQEDVIADSWRGVSDLCLYAHVPFCEVRCAFCEYTVVGRDESARDREYMRLLLRELELYRDALDLTGATVQGFDIGGGTPGFVDADLVAELVETVRAGWRIAPDVELSIETTPRLAALQPAKLAAYRRCGIERLSMGVQVVDPDLLRALRRTGSSASLNARAVDSARAAGFRSLNLDLMYGFAGQGLESWRATLEHALALEPDHVTLYRMRYKLTRISHQAPSVRLDDVREQAHLAKAILADRGYEATTGKTTWTRAHGTTGTSSYLTRRVRDGMPYLGFGLGAQSFSPTTIAYNDGAAGKNLAPYERSLVERRLPVQDLYDLPLPHVMGKMAAVSFYFGEIDGGAFERRFGLGLADAFPHEVRFVLDRGLMAWAGESLRLTPTGADASNGVIALFFAPSIQRYLVERDPDRAGDMTRARRAALAVAGEREQPVALEAAHA
jgi:oxygen-independent coproporphyrinogen-3 oxidase